MQMNQKGEIVTTAVIATFVILGIATLAASALTQNQKTTFTSSSRAADASCYVGKSCGIPACNDTLGGNSASCSECNGGWCRGGQCANCGKGQPVKGGVGAGGSSNNKPGTPNAEGKYKCRQRDNTNAPYCNGGKSFIDTWCDGCAPEKGCKEVETCYNGVASGGQSQQPAEQQPITAPPAQQPPAQQPAPDSGSSGNSTGGSQPSGGNTGSGGTGGSSQSPAGGNTNGGGTSQPDTSSYTCSVRAYFKDSSTGENIKNVSFTFTPDKGSASSGTGSLTDYYSSGAEYKAGNVKISAKADGYVSVDSTQAISPTGVNSICEVTINMAKSTSGAATDPCAPKGGYQKQSDCKTSCNDDSHFCKYEDDIKCFLCFEKVKTPTATAAHCPAPMTNDSACNGKCAAGACKEIPVNGTTCYSCTDRTDCTSQYPLTESGKKLCAEAVVDPSKPGCYQCKPQETANKPACTYACFSYQPDGYESVPTMSCSDTSKSCYKQTSGTIALEIKNSKNVDLKLKRICVTEPDTNYFCLDSSLDKRLDVTLKKGDTYVDTQIASEFCKRFPNGNQDVYIELLSIPYGNNVSIYPPLTCKAGQTTYVVGIK
jgi:hypothetical protein